MSIAPATPSATARIGRVTFYGRTLARISSLLGVVATRLGISCIQPLGTASGAKLKDAINLSASPVSHDTYATPPNADERVKARIGPDADVRIDGKPWLVGAILSDDGVETSDVDTTPLASHRSSSSRNISESPDAGLELVIRRSQWRIRIQPVAADMQSDKPRTMEAILGAVKLDAFTNERARNAELDFLQ